MHELSLVSLNCIVKKNGKVYFLEYAYTYFTNIIIAIFRNSQAFTFVYWSWNYIVQGQ
jgi:hypothetical protein